MSFSSAPLCMLCYKSGQIQQWEVCSKRPKGWRLFQHPSKHIHLATLLNSLMSSSSFLVAFSGLSRWLSGKESSCQCRRLEM